MREELLHHLRQITAEEKALLQGHADIQKEIYTSSREFVVDNAKLLQRGHLIEIRPHTRFTHFPDTVTTTPSWSICAAALPHTS